MTVYVGKKWDRAMEIARDNHLPYINFVESAGGDLRMGTGKKGDQPPLAPLLEILISLQLEDSFMT